MPGMIGGTIGMPGTLGGVIIRIAMITEWWKLHQISAKLFRSWLVIGGITHGCDGSDMAQAPTLALFEAIMKASRAKSNEQCQAISSGASSDQSE